MNEYNTSQNEDEKKGFNLINQAMQLPMVHIDRNEFLNKELSKKVGKDILERAIKDTTIVANIPVEILDKIAKACINSELSVTVGISTLAGIPGGLAMIGTVPADVIQFYGHILRVAQKLAYIYGYKDFKEFGEEQNAVLLTMLGIMMGVEGANATLTKVTNNLIQHYGTKEGIKALGKTGLYKIAQRVAKQIGVKLTKDSFAKGLSKAVPILGGVTSGVLTFATFSPMAKKLQSSLHDNYLISSANYRNY